MRRLSLVMCALLCVVSWAAHAQKELPEDVENIAQYENDPIALVDAARRYQEQQLELIRWDAGLAQEHLAEEERSLANAKIDAMQKRVDGVRAVWEYVMDRYPNDPRALNYVGEYYYDMAGDDMSALTYWRRASMLDNQYGLADNNLGIYYFHLGNYARGNSYLEKALEIDKDNPDYLYNLAQMYLTHFPDLSRILEKNNKKLYKEAMAMSKRAMENGPGDFDLAQDYAVNFFAAENMGVEADWKSATSAWARARELATSDDQRFYTLLNEARCWMKLGKGENAVPLIEQGLAMMPDSEVAQNLLEKARSGSREE